MKDQSNTNLHVSRAGKTDEFYTDISMVENELKHYREYFKDKIVFCNCDDPAMSNFWRYFQINFYMLGLKKLISTHFEKDKPSYKLEIIRQDDKIGQLAFLPDYVQTPLQSDGDFRSPEAVELLKQTDIVVTNPPFSLFRDYMAQLKAFHKDFLVIGNLNAVTYKEVLPSIRSNEIWLGYTSGHFWFKVPQSYEEKRTDFKIDENGQKWRRMGNICWYTNLDTASRHEDITIFKKYRPELYPSYDNYEAIEVPKVSDIPSDYKGVMGVPITFLTRFNPDQFEIVDVKSSGLLLTQGNGTVKSMYKRVLIKNKRVQGL
ncbi:MAG: adenine-specific methyltransferase EcoRI family protein [Oenococcus sp.]|uniref:adenine-specific methyltransferase EcoRI family protein n=1 Tax=Oenococcus sp. TaxID=1979414 RepID=UPI0039E73903